MPFLPKFYPEHLREAQKLYSELKNGHLVAEKMGFGHTTVYKYLSLNKRKTPRWTDEEIQVLVDGYLEKRPVKDIATLLEHRSQRAVMIRMCRHRKWVKKDPRKKRALSAISFALRAVKKADVFRETEV